jgi:predicted nucleotidyltransferase
MGAVSQEQLIPNYVNKLVDCGHPLGTILFGSQARGTANDESDVDLLVIEESLIPEHRRAIPYRKALRPRFTPVDLLVLTPQEVEEESTQKRAFMVNVIEEGRWVYGNPGRAGLSRLGQ